MSEYGATQVEAAHPLGADEQRRCAEIARHYLGLALRTDYLNGGHGHQSSHRVLLERRRRALSAARLAAVPDAVTSRPRARRAPDSVDCEHTYCREVATLERLTSSEEYRLAVRMRRGEVEARNALIEANLGLVIMLARRLRRGGVPLMDLVAEGNLGLLAAARRFDPEVGSRFATYAKWYVLGAMRRAMNRMEPWIPASAESAVPIETPTEPVAEPVPASGDWEPEARAPSVPQERGEDEPVASWAEAQVGGLAPRVRCVSLELAVELRAPEAQEPAQCAQTAKRNASLQRALALLSERERTVIVSRFGLVDDAVPTLDVLAKRFCISIERVRQIEAAAVKKLHRLLRDQGQSAHTLL